MNKIEEVVQFFRVAFVEFKLSLSSEFAYRWQVLMWVISDSVQPIIFATLWTAVAMSGNRDFTSSEIVTYFFLVAIVSRFTQDWSIQFVSNSIIDGDFAKYLVRPFNYLAEMFGISLAIRTLRIGLLLPFLGIGYLLLSDLLVLNLNARSFPVFILSLLIGYILNFLLGNIVALSAFFIKQVVGLRALYVNVVSILSGEYIPLKVLAVGTFFIFEILPFRYVLSFPIEILTGSLTRMQLERGLLISITWLILLTIGYRVIFKVAIRKYEAEGI